MYGKRGFWTEPSFMRVASTIETMSSEPVMSIFDAFRGEPACATFGESPMVVQMQCSHPLPAPPPARHPRSPAMCAQEDDAAPPGC